MTAAAVGSAEASSDDEEELSPYAQNNVSFEDIGLGRSLRNTLAKANILRPSRIQSKCLLSLTYPNLHPPAIIQASSGTGKTVLSALALLLRLDLNLHGHIQAFSLVPNRELAAQLTKLLLKLRQSQYITVTSTAVDATWDWTRNVKSDVVVATYGKLDHWKKREMIKPSSLTHIKVVVFEEADLLLTGDMMGHTQQWIQTLQSNNSGEPQLIFSSATFGVRERDFARAVVGQKRVEAGSKQGRSVVRSISYCWMLCADEAAKVTKLKELLVKFADQEGCTVVFCNSIHQLGSLTSELPKQGYYDFDQLSGSMSRDKRDSAVQGLLEGRHKAMLTTDVLARGFDWPQIYRVVVFSPPVFLDGKADPTAFLHRVGRCGRFGKKGLALTLVIEGQQTEQLHTICQQLKLQQMQSVAVDEAVHMASGLGA